MQLLRQLTVLQPQKTTKTGVEQVSLEWVFRALLQADIVAE